MAKIGDNPCGKKFCNNNDKKLNGRIFNDYLKDIDSDTDKINYEEFLGLLLDMALEYNPDRSNFIYKQLTGLQLDKNAIKSIEYKYIQIAKTHGGGGETYYEEKVTTKQGRSS